MFIIWNTLLQCYYILLKKKIMYHLVLHTNMSECWESVGQRAWVSVRNFTFFGQSKWRLCCIIGYWHFSRVNDREVVVEVGPFCTIYDKCLSCYLTGVKKKLLVTSSFLQYCVIYSILQYLQSFLQYCTVMLPYNSIVINIINNSTLNIELHL